MHFPKKISQYWMHLRPFEKHGACTSKARAKDEPTKTVGLRMEMGRHHRLPEEEPNAKQLNGIAQEVLKEVAIGTYLGPVVGMRHEL